MSKTDFIHLHNHSEYSLLDGAFRIRDMISRARSMGMKAVALTDHGNMFGAVPFYREAVKAGIKPIIGMEAYLARKGIGSRGAGSQSENDHLVLLVKNRAGYRNLIRLSSIAYTEGFYYKPRIDLELLERHSEGLIGMSACLKGTIPQLILNNRRKDAENFAIKLASIFADGDFYLELQNHGIDEELRVIPELADMADRLGLPAVVTNDCHFKDESDHRAHDVLLCLQTSGELDDQSRKLRSHPETYFKTPDQMHSLFPEHPEAISNTLEIAQKCNFEMEDKETLLPDFPIPDNYDSPDSYLRQVVDENVNSVYAEITDEVSERIDYELSVIREMGFSGYFLIVWDIVRSAKNAGIPVGPGRGSAAGSIICYILGITSIDPLANGLLFERFLNPDRVSMPDIDIDFCDERRQEVIDHVVQTYGKENVCQIITFGRMAARAVIRDVGRVLMVPFGDVDRLAKMIPPQPGITLTEALKTVPDLKDLYENDENVRRVLDLSLSLEGMARHASTHAAGLVITPTPLVNHVPLFRSNKGEITTQYEMKILNSIGLLKIDILGLKTLSHITNTLKLVEQSEGVEMSGDDIPIDDGEAFKLLQRGQTVGIFQLESEGMRNLLRRIKPTAFQDVIAINALYRPGPLRSGMVDDFIECKHGRKKIKYMDPRLEPILKETYGVILYQEQVMRIASDLAGFSLGEADILRRAMGKKDMKSMGRMRKQFMEGAELNGLSSKKAERIFDLMSSFAEYGFNKSHSAAYAMVSMQTAFLKAHYPAAFMAAAMTNDMGNTDRLMFLLEECHALGIVVRPPDVNSSLVEFSLSGGEITYGLAAIKNLGIPAAEAIVEARMDGPFVDLYDLCERVNLRSINRRAMESLIKSGATDMLPGTRSQKIASLDDVITQAQKRQNERERGQTIFIFDDSPGSADSCNLRDVPPWDEDKKLREEKESLGFYFSGHPLDRYKNVLSSIVNTGSINLAKKKKGRNVIIAGLINGVRVIQDRRGNSMAFVTMEDFYGSFEAIVFASCYSKVREELVEENAVVIRGKTSNRDRGETKIIADDIYSVDRALAILARKVVLTLLSKSFNEKSLASLKDVVSRYSGRRELVFDWRENGSELFSIRSGNCGVEPSLEFVDRVKKIDGVENVKVSV